MDVNKAKGEPGLQTPAGQMDKPVNYHAFESTLPKAVKRRVHALKRLQLQSAHIEAKFYEEVHELERKYAELYRPLYDKRRDFVTGTVEPTDAECEWSSDKDEELTEQMKRKLAIDPAKKEDSAPAEDPKGVPDFWLTILRNADMLTDMIQEHDEPILKHLKDIQVKFSEPGQYMSFTLEFHFEPNSYFTNAVLTKVYKMKCEPDASEPFSFEGPEIIDCTGCVIDWQKGKDVTVKTIKKKQKHKGRGTVRTVTKQVSNLSFFNFFNPVKGSPDDEIDEDSDLAFDFEIGHLFRERIVPRAVLYFTGEAMEDDESFDEELEEGDEEQDDDDDDEDDDDDDDDDDEGDFDPRPNAKRRTYPEKRGEGMSGNRRVAKPSMHG